MKKSTSHNKKKLSLSKIKVSKLQETHTIKGGYYTTSQTNTIPFGTITGIGHTCTDKVANY